ncbi:hypothetical protein E2320_020162 [Naja naja]|nr:hypothetical protein E2320_020162 [Naja naja]
MGMTKRRPEEKPKFRSIVHAVQAGIFVERIDKARAMALILHAADISHPSKLWDLHYRWTKALMEEFFRQGDKEAELGLPFSPLCDRKSTMVAQSQIVKPTFALLTDSMEKIVFPLIEEASKSESSTFVTTPSENSTGSTSSDIHKKISIKNAACVGGTCSENALAMVDLRSFKDNLFQNIQENKDRWKDLAEKDQEDELNSKKVSSFYIRLLSLLQFKALIAAIKNLFDFFFSSSMIP